QRSDSPDDARLQRRARASRAATSGAVVLGAPAVEGSRARGAQAQAQDQDRERMILEWPSPAAVVDALWSWKASFVYGYIAWALFVHLRGRERHRFHKQLTDHSTIVAPYNAVMYSFSAGPNQPFIDMGRFPELKPLQENW